MLKSEPVALGGGVFTAAVVIVMALGVDEGLASAIVVLLGALLTVVVRSRVSPVASAGGDVGGSEE